VKTILVQICFGTHCTMMGAMDILESVNSMKEEIQDYNIQIEIVKCFGDCKADHAPVVIVDQQRLNSATTDQVMARIMEVAAR
jgi:NADH:ubiquinone oxidoreductase subunit E